MNERIERCETCRWWSQYDEDQPAQITKREFWGNAFDCDKYPAEQVEAFMRALPDDMEAMIDNHECDGDCRRRAPVIPSIMADDDDSDPSTGRWPITNVGDWCGEWQPIQPAAATKAAAE